MMKYLSILFVAALFSFSGHKDGAEVLKDMHNRYAGNWYKTSTWYEAIIFPEKFRIDFDDRKSGNAVLYLGDSMYVFRKNKMVTKRYNDDNLTFLLGGMYFYSFDTALSKLNRMGYDTKKFHENTWKGKPVYVIGAT